ncbi:S8 family serine peptidase [Franconibacter helveticus]|uniref:S8 family serine peptidase n=1 Tax=Franconibacter helveticus TaxID=357240 RepID=UPI001EF79FB6|nr:S8 family serine peptidase [Franconibacter helveticus]
MTGNSVLIVLLSACGGGGGGGGGGATVNGPVNGNPGSGSSSSGIVNNASGGSSASGGNSASGGSSAAGGSSASGTQGASGIQSGSNAMLKAPVAKPGGPALASGETVTRTPWNQNLFTTNAAAARAAGVNGAGVTVGVADTGIDSTNPALQGAVTSVLNYVDPATNNLSVGDVRGHGTSVAQTLAGRTASVFSGGTASGASLVSARIIPDSSSAAYSLSLAQVNSDLARAGAKIINNSWEIPDWDLSNAALTGHYVNAWKPFIAQGGLVVFASGNESAANPTTIASLPVVSGSQDLEKGWLVVTATNNLNAIASYANRCGISKNNCLAAPGNVYVLEEDAQGNAQLRLVNGTSFAAPQVSGAAAQIWQQFPYFSNDLVRQTLLGTAADLGAPGVDEVYGYGMLDVGKAIKGPAKFDWGDVSVSFDDYSSTWSNPISGAGGLIKNGTGTLVMSEEASYTGATRVLGGILSGKGIASSASIGSAGALDMRSVKGDVDNRGYVILRDGETRFGGNYTQYGEGHLAFMLGSTLNVAGNAALDGDLHVLGVPQGYVTKSQQEVINAGAVQGQFSSFTQEPGVFLDASVGYSANQVWLNIQRLQATQVSGVNYTPAAASGAARLEQAFVQLDSQPADAQQTAFAATAAQIQQTPTAQAAQATLESLSGQLPAASGAMAYQSINLNQRRDAEHIAQLMDAPQSRQWAERFSWNGSLGHAGLTPVNYAMNGWVTGQDTFIDANIFVGSSLMFANTSGSLNSGGESSRGTLNEAALYGGKRFGGYYVTGRLASGYYDGDQHRMLWLGSQSERVSSRQSGSWFTLGSESGYRFSGEKWQVTPFADGQYISLRQRAFEEQSQSGFGLKADDQTTGRWQAGVGLRTRYTQDLLNYGRLGLSFQTHYQRTVSQESGRYQASFTGLDQAMPLTGVTAPQDVWTTGVSLMWQFNDDNSITLGGEHTLSDGRSDAQVQAGFSIGF